MWAGCVPAACAIGEGAVCRRAALCPHAGMYGDYVSWLADGKSAKVMKAHELVDADCRCAALPRAAPPRAAPRRPCPPVSRRPVSVARLGAARSCPACPGGMMRLPK